MNEPIEEKSFNKFIIDQIIADTENGLINGNLNLHILSDDFQFISPFWKGNNKKEFSDEFLDPREYREKSLSNNLRSDPVIRL